MSHRALELFRAACGLNAPLSLEYDDLTRPEAGSARRSFDRPFVLVGRHPRVDLPLDHADVSQHHVFLQTIAGRVFVRDLQSRNQVYWEGEVSARSAGWLDFGRFIRVGPYRIRRTGRDVSEPGDAILPAVPAGSDYERSDTPVLPRVALEFPFRVGGVASVWPVDEPLAMVGRCEICQLVLTDESISRFHAALVVTPSGIWVIDLLAREGVVVNEESVRWAWLGDGDTMRLGRFSFIVRYEAPPDGLTRRDVPLAAGARLVVQPGTEMVTFTRQHDAAPSAGVARLKTGAPAGRKPVASQSAAEPALVVPSVKDAWQPSFAFSPNPLAMWERQIQMMESFHNDMIMMVQMFVAMHQEHSASVRQELEMVQRLTRELVALQANTARSPDLGNGGVRGGHDRASREGSSTQAIDRKKPDRKMSPADGDASGKRTKPASTDPASRPQSADSRAPAPAAIRMGPRGPDEPLAVDTGEFHADLTQRIAQLQRERQGYWQRILKTIHG